MTGEYRPPRVNAAGFKCAICSRKFAAGYLPPAESHGPYAGKLICRDCREERFNPAELATPLF